MALNEGHTQMIVEYLRFARYKRAQRLKAVDAAFGELKESRLSEDTFTSEEVGGMLDGLCAMLHGDIESELIDSAHSNVILIRQMCTDAQKWHIQLNPDIALLEQKNLLEEISQFEREQFAATAPGAKAKLTPLAEAASPALLQQEMNRIKEQSAATIKAVESERDSLRSELEKLKKQQSASVSSGSKETASLMKEIEALRGELAIAHEDLDKKFSETTQYNNMKKMLETKNAQLRELRSHQGES